MPSEPSQPRPNDEPQGIRPYWEEDDGEDYELEEPDQEIVAHERRRAEYEVEKAHSAVDIDAMYTDAEGSGHLDEMLKDFKFKFQTKHLLILTAVVAVILTLLQRTGGVAGLIFLALIALGGAHAYLGWQEHKRQQEVARRRAKAFERQRRFYEKQPVDGANVPDPPPEEPPKSRVDEIWEEAAAENDFKFNFSLQQMFVVFTIACIVLGLMSLRGLNIASLLLGLIALGGLGAHAIGIEPPPKVVLGWWFLLLLYIATTLLAAIF